MSTVALVVNPTSSKGRGGLVGRRAAAALRANGHDVTDISADSWASSLRAARAAVAQGVESLVCVGGDGMVHLGVNACAQSGTAFGLVAAGTGNDLARNLGLPIHDPEGAVAVVSQGTHRVIDLGHDTGPSGRWFAGVLGAGFDAIVNARAARMSWPRGQMRYNLAIVRELPVFRPIPYTVRVDGTRVETDAMLVAVANTTSFGGGMKVCPDARPDDGQFDVVILHRVSTAEFLRVFPRVFSGGHVSHPAVQQLRGRTVSLAADGIPSHADGEMFEPLPITLECTPAALRVHVPAGTAAS